MQARIQIQNLSISQLEDLTLNGMMDIFGGAPTLDTSFAYDVSWAIGRAARWVADLF